MDSVEIYNLLRRKNSPVAIAHYKREFIESIAAEQGRSIVSLGEAIYQIAAWLDGMGNKGMLTRFFDDELAKDAIEKMAHLPAWENILFKNDDGQWYARKRPHWRLAWGIRYGWDGDFADEIITLHHEEAIETHAAVIALLDSQKPKRSIERIAGKRAEELPTIQVAYVAAVAFVLYRRYSERRFGYDFDSPNGILRWHYQTLHYDALAELKYRTESKPEDRSSKKKTQAAIKDWAKAAEFLKAGTLHFFSHAFIQQAVESATEPDLDVDYEHLPKLPLEQTPIRWLRDGELVEQFMKWVDEECDPGSFEWDDKQAIMRQLRAMFARAKGQKTDEEIAITADKSDG